VQKNGWGLARLLQPGDDRGVGYHNNKNKTTLNWKKNRKSFSDAFPGFNPSTH